MVRVKSGLSERRKNRSPAWQENDGFCRKGRRAPLQGMSPVADAQKIIDAGVVESGQLDENLSGNIVFPGFVLGIAGLGHPQKFCHLRLVQICILPQISESVYGAHLKESMA